MKNTFILLMTLTSFLFSLNTLAENEKCICSYVDTDNNTHIVWSKKMEEFSQDCFLHSEWDGTYRTSTLFKNKTRKSYDSKNEIVIDYKNEEFANSSWDQENEESAPFSIYDFHHLFSFSHLGDSCFQSIDEKIKEKKVLSFSVSIK